MSKYLVKILLVTTLLTVSSVAQNVSAEKVLYIEFRITQGDSFKSRYIYRIPNNHNFVDTRIGGGYLSTAPIDPRFSEFEFFIFKADKIDEKQTSIGIAARYADAKYCNVTKELTINNDVRTKIKLECRVRAYAFYAPDIQDKTCFTDYLLSSGKNCEVLVPKRN